jgi:FkbM family methyltransferase
VNTATLITAVGRLPFMGWALRRLAHCYREGSVVTLRSGVAAGMRWRRHHRYVNGYWIGQYELPIQEGLARELKPGMVFFDVGANAGFFTLVAAKLVGSQGKCVAFDPMPENVESVRQQIKLNELGYCTAVQKAVGAHVGEAEFTFGTAGDSTGRFGSGGDGKTTMTVKVTTLDEAIARFGRPDFIKMDIEGAEVDALAGAERVLKEERPTWLIELHGPDCERGVRRIMSEHGYGFFDLRNNPILSGMELPHHVLAKMSGDLNGPMSNTPA